jgi:hypothetical protein
VRMAGRQGARLGEIGPRLVHLVGLAAFHEKESKLGCYGGREGEALMQSIKSFCNIRIFLVGDRCTGFSPAFGKAASVVLLEMAVLFGKENIMPTYPCNYLFPHSKKGAEARSSECSLSRPSVQAQRTAAARL